MRICKKLQNTKTAFEPRLRYGGIRLYYSAVLVLTGLLGMALFAWPSATAQTRLLISTIAGSSGGNGLVTLLHEARGIAVASSSVIYIADTGNHVVRKVDVTANSVTIVAGQLGLASPVATAPNGDGGPALAATFNLPSNLTLDSAGNLYIADTGNHRLRKVNAADGVISTVAGNGIAGVGEGNAFGAVFSEPRGLSYGADGKLYVADSGNHRVVAITGIAGPTPSLAPVAGVGVPGSNGDGSLATIATLQAPMDVALDGATLYIADTGNHKIRVVTGGINNTLAGTGEAGANFDSGTPTEVRLNSPAGVAVDALHRVYIADTDNHRVRLVDGNFLSTSAGRSSGGFNGDGTPATAYALKLPRGIGVAGADIFFMDSGNGRLRKINGTTLSTVVSDGSQGFGGDGGPATQAKLNLPAGIAVDSAGNYYIADTFNHVIRKVNASNQQINTIASTPGVASADPAAANGDGGLATAATLHRPAAVAVDQAGIVYIADTYNHRVRKIASNGVITTIAGNGFPTTATLNEPVGLAVDSDNKVYIADRENHVVRVYTATPAPSLTILVGQPGSSGYIGDDGFALLARLNHPSGVAVDGANNVYIADTNNHRVRLVSGGVITNVTGIDNSLPRSGFAGDGGNALNAALNSPAVLTVQAVARAIYFSDQGNLRVRELSIYFPPNNAPVPMPVANQSLNKNQVLDVALSATDADGDAVTFSTVPTLSFLTIINANPAARVAVLHIAPGGANVGVYTVRIQATDEHGIVGPGQLFTITVNDPDLPPPNRPPVAVAAALPAALEAPNGVNVTAQLNGTASSDPDGDPLTYEWTDNGQAIATTATASVTLALGPHSIVLTVRDNRGASNATAAQSVTVTAPQPVPLSIATLTPNEGQRSTTISVIITGTGFTTHSIFTVNGGGVTVTSTFISGTEVRASFAITRAAQLGTRAVTVTNPGSGSFTLPAAFTIRP